MGTAGYMSPEQARGEKLDVRTDLFSFGLVLYEMATGHRAFEGDTGPALHSAILTQTPVPVQQWNAQLPARLGQIITKALEKNREVRYQTVAEMRAELAALARKMERRDPNRWWAMTAALTAILIVGAIFWFMGRRFWLPVTPSEARFQQLTINSSENPVTSGAISPDGKHLAYADLKGMHIKLIGIEGLNRFLLRKRLRRAMSSGISDLMLGSPAGTDFSPTLTPQPRIKLLGLPRRAVYGCSRLPAKDHVSFATTRWRGRCLLTALPFSLERTKGSLASGRPG